MPFVVFDIPWTDNWYLYDFWIAFSPLGLSEFFKTSFRLYRGFSIATTHTAALAFGQLHCVFVQHFVKLVASWNLGQAVFVARAYMHSFYYTSFPISFQLFKLSLTCHFFFPNSHNMRTLHSSLHFQIGQCPLPSKRNLSKSLHLLRKKSYSLISFSNKEWANLMKRRRN